MAVCSTRMENSNKKKQKFNVKGVPVNGLMYPAIILLVVLIVVVFFSIAYINGNSRKISKIMQNTGIATSDATSLLAGTMQLSETTTNYVLRPIQNDGEYNVGSLMAIVSELSNNRRGDDVLSLFKEDEVDIIAVNYIAIASNAANSLFESQMHAVALTASVYPFPNIPALKSLPLPELTDEELSWSNEEKLLQAETLLLQSSYGKNKYYVNLNVNSCIDYLNNTSEQQISDLNAKSQSMRYVLYSSATLLIIVTMAILIILYILLIGPLNNATNLISFNNKLNEKQGFKEIRLLATAYNSLQTRRDELDSLLRTIAEKDILTELPNRYGFEQYMKTLFVPENSNKSIAYILFDLNHLKLTNDTKGHEEGDKLLKRAADCIAYCFKLNNDNNCFRVGGDEFVSILTDVSVEDVDKQLNSFLEEQKKRNISISYGYDYSDSIGSTTIGNLMRNADYRMYDKKKEMHEEFNKLS